MVYGDLLVGGNFTDPNGKKVKAIVVFKNYYDATDFIGERISPFKDGRRVHGSYGIYDFELATKENTPQELWEYLPTTTTDVTKENTDTMKGENNMEKELKVGDIVLVKSCDGTLANYDRLIGCRGIITIVNKSDYLIKFELLPEKFDTGSFKLHDGVMGKDHKYAFISKKDVVPVDNPEPTIVISKDKKTLVEFIEETNENNFKGRVLRNVYEGFPCFKVGDCGSFWIKDAFEPATRDNVPSEWKHIIPEPKPIEEIKEICSECVEIKREDEKPKYKVIKLSPTENQERQYGVHLFNHMTNIVNGQTVAFINSKTSGGVIYGKKAGALLYHLKQNNPNKLITIVKKLKSNSIKQLSIRIVDRSTNEFTL